MSRPKWFAVLRGLKMNGNDAMSSVAWARRELKKLFGDSLSLKTDFKPNGWARQRWGEIYLIHTFGQGGLNYSRVVLKNLNAFDLKKDFISALKSLPSPIVNSNNHLVFPVNVDCNN